MDRAVSHAGASSPSGSTTDEGGGWRCGGGQVAALEPNVVKRFMLEIGKCND